MTEPVTQALAELDRRGRTAAGSLNQVIADLDVDTGRPAPSPAARRNAWLAAAAIVAVAGLVAGFLALRDEPTANVVSGNVAGPGDYLLPVWLPEGWQFESATDVAPDDPTATTGETVVYGDSTLADPWTGPQLALTVGTNLGDTSTEGAERIELTTATGPRDAFVREDSSLVVVEWTDSEGRRRSVAGRDVSREAVLAAATYSVETNPGGLAGLARDGAGEPAATEELAMAMAEAAAIGDPFVLPWGLPDGFAEMARGPLGASPLSATATFPGLRLAYGQPGSPGPLTVLQRPGDATAAELLKTSPFGAAPIEVRGVTGYSTGFTLQWYEPSTGMLLTIVGELAGLDTDDLLRVAEGLRPAEPDEIEQLIRAGERREVVVAEGDHDGPWRLVATVEQGREGLRLEHDGTVNAELEVDGASGGLEAAFGAPDSALADAHYGIASPDAVEVVVETPDGQRIPFETYDVVGLDGWHGKAFLGFLPNGVDEGYAFVAYDADGEVVGSIRLDPAVGG